MSFTMYPVYVLQIVPSRRPVRFYLTLLGKSQHTCNNFQVPQAVEIRAPTHPLKNLRTFSDGTV